MQNSKILSYEKKVLEARVKENLSISQISDDVLLLEMEEVIYRVSKISGMEFSESQSDLFFLKSELIIFLKNFGYLNLNLDEILLAFRINCDVSVVLKSGIEIEKIKLPKTISVDVFSSVLKNYMIFRNVVDRKLQNIIDGY